jgi:glycosyltransferase involved in cell wall biosynthesis
MLENITPVLLTFNEESNVERTLSRLVWARDIVVVDSGSSDRTLEILERFPNVRIFHRSFDSHADQWSYAVGLTDIKTPWVLRLDADYQIGDRLVAELAELTPKESIGAYRARFDYAIFSHRLLSSLYPANTILLRRGRFSIEDRGHTEGWVVSGSIGELKAPVVHDDWKSTDQFVRAQSSYMRRELQRLRVRPTGLVAKLRLLPPLMPIAVFFYCLFWKGLLFNGRPGIFYSLQRMLAETVLSLMALEQRLRGEVIAKQDRGAHSNNRDTAS